MQVNFLEYHISSHRSYLLVKLHFWCFLDTQNSCYLKVQKTAKMRFYKQVRSVKLRYSKKLTCNKFEVSDFLNFEKILKIRWKTQKRVIFTKMLFSLRRVKTALVKRTLQKMPQALILQFCPEKRTLKGVFCFFFYFFVYEHFVLHFAHLYWTIHVLNVWNKSTVILAYNTRKNVLISK